MERLYLYVPPEEYPAAQAAGALWDDASKRWSIAAGDAAAPFARWLEEEDEEGFQLMSDRACVAAALSRCGECGETFEVICVFGVSGTDVETGEALSSFTVSNLWAMDGGLAAQLRGWPGYQWEPALADFAGAGAGAGAGVGAGSALASASASASEGGFANHCAFCGAVREEASLHSEPGDVFFGLSGERAGVRMTALEGRVWMSGDYSFGV